MKKLIIYGHPNEKSYGSAIVESYKDGAESAGYEVEIIDIYRDNKQLFLEFVNDQNIENTKIMQKKINSADKICFVFPIWNFESPAIVKNFWDVNFSKGFAYKTENGKNIGLLSAKSGCIIATAGVNSWFVKTLYKVIFYIIRGQGRFGFADMKYLGATINMDTMNPKKDDQRKEFLTKVYGLGMK